MKIVCLYTCIKGMYVFNYKMGPFVIRNHFKFRRERERESKRKNRKNNNFVYILEL